MSRRSSASSPATTSFGTASIPRALLTRSPPCLLARRCWLDSLPTTSALEVSLSRNVTRLGRLDLPGAGQVRVEGNYAYVGHLPNRAQLGTSILDVSDPRKPRVVSQIHLEDPRSHSHKARVVGELLFVNSEQNGPSRQQADQQTEAGAYDGGGFRIYDVSDRAKPKLVHFEKTGGRGVHRFDVDARYAYISTEMAGYVGNILVIYDLRDPTRPEEVSRWWMPGASTSPAARSRIGRGGAIGCITRCASAIAFGPAAGTRACASSTFPTYARRAPWGNTTTIRRSPSRRTPSCRCHFKS